MHNFVLCIIYGSQIPRETFRPQHRSSCVVFRKLLSVYMWKLDISNTGGTSADRVHLPRNTFQEGATVKISTRLRRTIALTSAGSQ